MTNFSLSVVSILGLLQILGSLGYFAVSITQITTAARSRHWVDLVLRILQVFFAPISLFVSGAILIFYSWKFDPLMQLQQLLLNGLIVYVIFLDLKILKRPT